MMKLEDFRPTEEEERLTEGMPEQVALGYIRTRRRDHLKKLKCQSNPIFALDDEGKRLPRNYWP